jgi:hypothetical protein
MSEHTAELSAPPPEPETRSGSKRGIVAVVASVVAVVLVAGGGYAAWQFFSSGGPRPAEVLPDTTFALVTVDLNPSGGQKVEAIKTLRKFPSWKKRTGITPDSDVMKAIFDEALKDGPCKALDYEKDIKPWIGHRAGLGGVVLGGKPAPVLALQISDVDKAKTGFAALAKCADPSDKEFGFTTTDDYVIASDSTAHAQAIVAAGTKAPLAENADFQKWTDEVGGPGIVNAYLSRTSPKILSTLDSGKGGLGGLTDGLVDPGGLGGLAGGASAGGVAFTPGSADKDEIANAFKDFKGAAAGLRFADGGIELAFAGGGAKAYDGKSVGRHVSALPKDTAAVLALAVPEKALDGLKSGGSSQEGLRSLTQMFTEGTGLELPDDLVTLLGSSVSVSLGGDAPAKLSDLSGPGDLPIGLLVHGDDAAIKAVVAKVEAKTGASLSDLPATLSSKDGEVALSTQSGYAQDLLGDGSLGDAENFKDVVTHASESQGIFYLSLDNGWTDALRDAADGQDKDADEAAQNLAALRAVGFSAWSQGDTAHGLLRVALK